VLTVILTRMFTFAFIVYMFANFKGDKMFFSSMAMLSVGEFALLVAQEAQNFNIGIDLISISTAIIFITAILMSLTLNHSDKLYEPTKDHIPYGLRKKLDKFSNYIKAISEELDLDNKYSKGLKSNVFRALLGVANHAIIHIWMERTIAIPESISDKSGLHKPRIFYSIGHNQHNAVLYNLQDSKDNEIN